MHVDLKPRLFWGDTELTDCPYMFLFGAEFGTPETLREVLETELFDGSSITADRQDNRECTFQVAIVDEPDIYGLEMAGKRLEDEAQKERNLLRYEPDGFGTPWVMETFRADIEFNRVDEQEMGMVRVYTVTMPAAPTLRSAEPVVVAAAESGEATPEVREVIDDGTSTTGWSATRGTSPLTVTAGAGGVGAAVPVTRTNLTRNGSFKTTASPWVASTGTARVRRVESFGGRSGGVLDVEANWGTNFGTLKWSYAYPGHTYVVSPGQRLDVRYKYRFENNPDEGPMPAGFLYRWRNASGTPIGADQFYSAAAFTGTSWRDVAFKLPAPPAGATQVQIIPRLGASYTVAGRWYIDDFMVATSVHATTVGAYFDGSTPASDGIGYGWSGTPYNSTSIARAVGPVTLTRVGAIDFTDTPYLHVDHYAAESGITVTADGEPLTLASGPVVLGAGKWRSVFAAPEGAVNELSLTLGSSAAMAPAEFYVAGLARTTISSPLSSTGRQLFRSFPVHGTARTPGSLHMRHEEPLGQVMLHAWRDDGSGFAPSCRRWKVDGAADLADTSAATGAATPLTEPMVFELPTQFVPDATYRAFARVRSASTVSATLTWQATTGGPTIGAGAWEERTAQRAITSEWSIVDLGALPLPTIRAAANSHLVLQIELSSSAGSVLVDDLYLTNASDGSTVILDSALATNLWVDAPTIDHPFPSIMAGLAEDRSDAFAVESFASVFEPAAWRPGTWAVFSVCDQPNAAVEVSYYPRFLHNAYQIETAS